jgi:hypothetical protein
VAAASKSCGRTVHVGIRHGGARHGAGRGRGLGGRVKREERREERREKRGEQSRRSPDFTRDKHVTHRVGEGAPLCERRK